MQITAAAPAPTPSAPSAPATVTATGITDSLSPPPAPEVSAAPKAKADKKLKAQLAPAVENAKDTTAQTQVDFENAVRDLEKDIEGTDQEGKAEKGKEKAAPLKGADTTKATEEIDPLQAELDAAEAAAGLKKAEEPKDEAKAKTEDTDEAEPPEASADKDVYEAWKKTLSKPAAKKIEQLERRAAKAQEAAADRIVLQPTVTAPLSHITNLEQLEAETAYWKDVRNQIRKGEVVKITGADGKKLELDPEIEEDLKTLNGYQQWAEAALDAAPDAKERIKTRLSAKPWEQAEKLAPGMISEKDSFANKEALKILRAAPSLQQMSDYEVPLAHMVRSMQMDEDQKPSAEFPKGRFRYVKLPLDKEGNVVQKKAVASKQDSGKKPPTAVDSKPMAQAKETSSAGYQQAETSRNPDDLRAALAAEMRSWK